MMFVSLTVMPDQEMLLSGNTAIKSFWLMEISDHSILYMQESMPLLINMATTVNAVFSSFI